MKVAVSKKIERQQTEINVDDILEHTVWPKKYHAHIYLYHLNQFINFVNLLMSLLQMANKTRGQITCIYVMQLNVINAKQGCH